MEPITAISSKIITPVGLQYKKNLPWYPQEVCGEWPHQASALSLGESNILKYSTSFPLRTGLDCAEDRDFAEDVIFLPSTEEEVGKQLRKVEELFLSRGVCVLSEGTLGGPSFLKGLYRPLVSYSTGAGIRSVVKTKFTRDREEGSTAKDSYVCLVEKGGISLYAEGRSETHVAYMPEFEIDRVVSCAFGLIVIPSKTVVPETDDSKFLYMLTHPIKQVSRIWYKGQPGNDFYEFDTAMEKLLWCENDLCVFWSLKNDKFILRRLVRLEKKDIVHSSTLNASIYYTNQEPSSSPFTPAGGSSMYSPFGKPPPKTSAMRINREGATVYYWPSFDFSDATGPGLSVGFYPPHYCVYDDPEFYLRLIFQIDLNPNGKWVEPRKFQLVSNNKQPDKLALWYLMKNNLYLHSVGIESGSRLSHFALKDVEDFVCSGGESIVQMITILTTDGSLKFGWLDQNFCIVVSAKLHHEIERPISSLNNFLFSDTLVCGIKDEISEKAVIVLKNIGNSGLISKCMNQLAEVIPSKVIARLVANYMGGKRHDNFNQEWAEFIRVVKELLINEHQGNVRNRLGLKIYNAVECLRENLKANGSFIDCVQKLTLLSNSILVYSKDTFPMEAVPSKSVPLFQKFLDLLVEPNPTKSRDFENLPEIMQVLLDKPDTLESMKKLTVLRTKENNFAPIIELLIADVFQRNQLGVQFGWPESVIKNVGRLDYMSGLTDFDCTMATKDNDFEDVAGPFREKEEGEEEPTWTSHVLSLRVFSEDRRLEEVCRLLDSASPLTIDMEQRAEMSDHEFVEEQEKFLLQLIQITFSASVGRAAFTLRTELKNFANLTSVIHLPRLCLSGKCATRGTTIELNDADLMTSSWPSFHNAVASSVSVKFLDQPADAWFAYNKAKTTEGPEQAGMVLGFGLNGILTAMPPTLRHEYLAKENSFTSMAMLLGLSANLAGTGDIGTWKVISLHIGAMLPACTTELEIPRLATLVAPCALGLLFMGTQNSHIAKVLLGEISKRYNPLSIFGGTGTNNSANNPNAGESNGSIADREAHSLCAGFGLGFVNLGKSRSGSMDEDGFDGILRRFVVGGPKPVTFNDDEEDLYNQYGQTLPSLWEEYRCCHIEEGDNVNVDVTTPSAIVAVALTYLRSGNEAVLKWLSPPSTLHLLDGVRPDLLMLRSLASILVYKDVDDLSVEWLEMNLMPAALAKSALKKPEDFSRLDHESINQAWASIVCGYCLGLGICLAGTSDSDVVETLWHYVDLFLNIASPDSQISEYFPKNFLESSICTLLISLSLVLAGSGDIRVLQLSRYMQSKVATTQITSSSNTYGMEMCISMSTGILFLGGGRYSLSNDDKSIAVLLASVFPKWPINANDNRYHLQALRHLYVLAAQPRLILPKPMPHRTKLKFCIEYLDGQVVEANAPVLLPPFHLLKKISLKDSEFLPIEFNLPNDLSYLKRIVEGNGVLSLVRKPVGSMRCNFLKQMAWRETRVFHSTFTDGDGIPSDESYEIKELNLISRMAESSGMRQIVPAVMAIKNGDSTKEDWVLQVRILYWWITQKAHQIPSSLPVELLGLFLNKAGNDLKIFSS